MPGRLQYLQNVWRTLCLVCVLALGLPTALLAQAEKERITFYDVQITVLKSGALMIKEDITVYAAGKKIRRGIYRDFPTRYYNRHGDEVRATLDLRKVLRDGTPEPYHTQHQSNGLRIYLGQEKHFLSTGQYTYTLRFRTDRQLGFFEDHDELYFNAIGHGWDFPIEKARIAVTLPQGVSQDSIRLDGFTGPQGIRGKNFRASHSYDGQIIYETTQPLRPHDGVTIVIGWPKGYVDQPSQLDYVRYFLSDNIDTLVGVIGLILLLAYYFYAWSALGRDPQPGTIIPIFEPPDGLSPAEVRYLQKRSVDRKTYSTAIVSMAVKGHVKIQEDSSGDYQLISRDGKEELSSEEVVMRNHYFSGGSSLDLDNENHTIISRGNTSFSKELDRVHRKVHFYLNRKYCFIGSMLSLFFVFTMLVSIDFNMQHFMRLSNLIYVIVLVAVNVLFYFLLEAPTRLGRRLLDRIEGFKMYLETAEGDEIAKMKGPEASVEIYERYLPYAMALDVENKWTDTFTTVLATAAAAAAAGSAYHSHWYSSDSGSSFSNVGSSLGSSLGSSIASSASAPGSSSGFSGGSSGGGGGGGGGGGW